LIEQADKHGRHLVLVDPKHTTTDCSKCGARAKHPLLSQRTYQCDQCGYVAARDKTPHTSYTTGQVSSRLALIA
jgi:putative transposase